MEKNIRIQYLGLQTKEVELKIDSYDKSVANELETQLKISTGFSDEDKNHFVIIFQIILENKEKSVFIRVEAHNHFEINQEITKEFENSAFINVNAPAIAFPYVRAFISNLTLNAGYDPIILPSFNFVKMFEDKKKEQI